MSRLRRIPICLLALRGKDSSRRIFLFIVIGEMVYTLYNDLSFIEVHKRLSWTRNEVD
jgi:hypothetical protein